MRQVWADSPQLAWSWKYSWKYTWNDPTAEHDDSVLYAMPFNSPQAPFKCCQAFGGTFSHQGPLHYSIDFKVPVGTPVLAAREGFISEVKSDSNEATYPPHALVLSRNCLLSAC